MFRVVENYIVQCCDAHIIQCCDAHIFNVVMPTLFNVVMPTLFNVVMPTLFNVVMPTLFNVVMPTLFNVVMPTLFNVVMPTLFNVVNKIVQYCYTLILQVNSASTMLNNIVANTGHCSKTLNNPAHPWAGCAFFPVWPRKEPRYSNTVD